MKSLNTKKIGVIVACRMKSSRLKKKAILPINGQPSILLCLDSSLRISNVDLVVLATSVLKEDDILENFILGRKVKLWRGDPDDVIQRYLGACEAFGIDVVIRVTADCPYISYEVAEILLRHHLKTNADYTAARKVTLGTGCEIYSTHALRKVIQYLGRAEYSEYMTWYFRNNPDIFKIELVDLPGLLIRDYRLTLDYPEDLEMFNKLYAALEIKNFTPSLKNIFKILDERKSISNINAHLSLRYKTDLDLIKKLKQVTKINISK